MSTPALVNQPTPPAVTSPASTSLAELLDRDLELSAAELGALTQRIAARPDLWRPLLRHDPHHRWYERLLLTPHLEVWLIGWAPGQGTLPHDHGDADGAMTVVEGVLTEDVYVGVTLQDQEIRPAATHRRRIGEMATFASDHVHRVRNLDLVNATSIHAYSPPGRTMRYYGAEAQAATVAPLLSIETMLARARRRLTRLSPPATREALDAGALLVDIRPQAQRQAEGAIPGATVIERNLLEWRLDPQSPWRIPQVTDHRAMVIVFCSEGYTSSLAAASLQDLGLSRATDLRGGFSAWKAAGLPVESA